MSKNTTKHALVLSIVALTICFTMLLGTTYAWFSDSVTSANNVIKTGTLKIAFGWAEGTKAVPTTADGWKDASSGAIFDYNLWEPGYVEVRHIHIANTGNLALKYQLAIKADTQLATNDEGHTLADAIDVYYLDHAEQIATRADLTENNKLGTLTAALAGMSQTATGVLYPAGTDASVGHVEDTITIALKMREDAGNEYQNMDIGGKFSVQILATQYTYEKDSFDDQYDKDANGTPDNTAFYGGTPVSTTAELKSALAAGGAVALVDDIELSDNLPVSTNSTLTLNGHTLSVATGKNIVVTSGAELVLEDGTVKSEQAYANGNGFITVNTGSTLTLEEGAVVETTGSNIAIKLSQGQNTINVKGGTIKTESAKGIVAYSNSVINVESGEITTGGYPVYVMNGSSNVQVTISGGKVVNTKGNESVGLAQTKASGTLTYDVKNVTLTFSGSPTLSGIPTYDSTLDPDGTRNIVINDLTQH